MRDPGNEVVFRAANCRQKDRKQTETEKNDARCGSSFVTLTDKKLSFCTPFVSRRLTGSCQLRDYLAVWMRFNGRCCCGEVAAAMRLK